MRFSSLALALALAACQAPAASRAEPAPAERTTSTLDLGALAADAPAYVARHYANGALPAALVADLTAAGFDCQHAATASRCTFTQQAFASCFDLWDVRISADAPVSVRIDRRCLGALPPQTGN